MRHNKKRGMKIGTDASHTKAMKKSLLCALFENDRIKTLESRAKAIRSDADKIVTWAKRGDVYSRRLAIAKMGDKELVREVFEKASQGMWAGRPGGYTRIIKLGPRKGDAAEVVIMEIVGEAVSPKVKAQDQGERSVKVASAPKLSKATADDHEAEPEEPQAESTAATELSDAEVETKTAE